MASGNGVPEMIQAMEFQRWFKQWKRDTEPSVWTPNGPTL